MNVVKLKGGLGNQLFQYAFGKVLEQNGSDVSYDTSFYRMVSIPPRPYILDKFKVGVPIASFTNEQTIREDRMPVDYDVINFKNCNFDGYWQYPQLYNNELVEYFREHFHVKEEYYTQEFATLRDEIRSCNAVAMHVRRGDYLSHPRHLVLPLSYYEHALMHIDVLRPNIKVYIFSDDIEWCQANFHDACFIKMEDYLEFELMRTCKHFIIANSTFSWWAAYLSLNSTIIASKEWAKDRRNGAVLHESRMLLPEFLKISLS